MKYFVDSLCSDLKTRIIALYTSYPLIYKYTTDMRNIVYSNTNIANDKSYISINQVGETRKEYNYIIYNIAVRVNYKGTLSVPYRDFYYICKGIRDSLTCQNREIADIETVGSIFNIIEILNLNGIVATRLDNNSYYSEMLFQCKVDITSIPEESLELV
jgi:hypothetical protein